MKKNLLMIFLILSLLVSCATKSVKPGLQDAPAEESLIEATVEVSEAHDEEKPVAVEEVVVEDVLEEVVEDEIPAVFEETVEEPSETQEASEAEFDWSAFAAADPSIWTAPITAKAEDSEAVEAATEIEAAVTVESEVAEPIEDVMEDPAVYEESSVVAEPETSIEPPKPIEPSASIVVDEPQKQSLSAKQIVENVGKFILREKLFSFGVLTIIIGFIYLIVALIHTSEARLERKDYRSSKHSARKAESSATNGDDAFESSSSDKTDTNLSDEDDEFLRTLLGGND